MINQYLRPFSSGYSFIAVALLSCLLACGDDTPKTYAAYQGKTILAIKKLDQAERSVLYRDTFEHNAEALSGTTNEKLGICLNDMIGNESGFMIFSVIVERCVKTYRHQPDVFSAMKE